MRQTFAWSNGKKIFRGRYGTKYGLAWDLICMGDIKLSKRDLQDLLEDLIKYISEKDAVRILERKGYRWVKLETD